MTFTVEPLGGHHDLEGFDCGKDDLSAWLREHARSAACQGTRTYLLVDAEGIAAGYFSLAAHLVRRDAMPGRVGRGAPREIPAILLAKLALDRRYQGRGLGTELLVRALERAVVAARLAGGKVIVVDAVDDDAARFYGAHDFEAIPGDPRRLVAKISSVAAALDLAWP